MGYHLHMLLHHMTDHVRHDYMEMMLHHIVTMFLYGFCFMLNITLAGAVVSYLHDIADIFTQYVRCWSETTYSTLTLLNALGMTISWFYTRLIVLPYFIYLTATAQPFHGMNFMTLKFLTVHLCILFVLHVFWFGRMLSVISKFLVGGGRLQEEP
jgi:ceramide synthetase